MVLFLSIAGTHELYRMLLNKEYRVQFWVPMIMNALLMIAIYLLVDSTYSEAQDWNIGHAQVLSLQNMFMVFCALIMIAKSVFLRPRATLPELTVPIFQVIYLGWLPSFFILLRAIPQGEFFLVWGLTSVAFSDIGAYFCGKYFGKHPYFQHLSPNKTLEGSIGGIICSVTVAFLLSLAFGQWLPIPWYHTLILSLGMACLGQVGDLIESMLKRNCGVKDSGTFIPGHGGILDRVDAYLLLAPFMYYYLINFVLIEKVPSIFRF